MTPAVEQALEASLELGSAGIVNFPCGEDKRPACWWKDEATADPEALRQLWAQAWRDPVLIGVPTGARNGIAVLDLDNPESDDWLKANGHRLPFTREHLTRSDGRHLFFRHRDGLKISAGMIAPGVDIRGEGGYVAWWPAAGHAVLHGYPRSFSVWDVCDLFDFPDWLFELAKPKPKSVSKGPSIAYQSPTVADAAIDGLIRKVATAAEGSRASILYWASRRMRERAAAGQISAGEAASLLRRAASHAGLPDHEAIGHIENGILGDDAA